MPLTPVSSSVSHQPAMVPSASTEGPTWRKLVWLKGGKVPEMTQQAAKPFWVAHPVESPQQPKDDPCADGHGKLVPQIPASGVQPPRRPLPTIR